jgi:hypothetical protein
MMIYKKKIAAYQFIPVFSNIIISLITSAEKFYIQNNILPISSMKSILFTNVTYQINLSILGRTTHIHSCSERYIQTHHNINYCIYLFCMKINI